MNRAARKTDRAASLSKPAVRADSRLSKEVGNISQRSVVGSQADMGMNCVRMEERVLAGHGESEATERFGGSERGESLE